MNKDIFHILLVEDDKYFRLGIKDILLKHGVVLEADNVEDANEHLSKQFFDLAIVDMHLGDEPLGLKVLEKARQKGIRTIVLSSAEDDEITEKAYKLGCRHFLAKKYYRKHLESYITKLLRKDQNKIFESFFQKSFITQDQALKDQIQKICDFDLKGKAVFLGGETGVGKTLVGKLIHKLNFDDCCPLIHLNCSEIPETLLEAELFGAKKGSYTGADKDRKGKLELANGGILFLDEIATMPKSMQQKLLKALDEKTFYPVGADLPVKSEFTLISATCQDLKKMIQEGEFREDLYYRITGLNLTIPPLRQRRSDINLLLKSALAESPRRIVIKQETKKILENYPWPGNVRELLKIADTLSMQDEGIISPSDLPNNIRNSEPECSDSGNHAAYDEDFILENGLKAYIKLVEKESVRKVLRKNSGKISKTIKDLKLSSSAFYRIHDSL